MKTYTLTEQQVKFVLAKLGPNYKEAQMLCEVVDSIKEQSEKYELKKSNNQ